MCDPVTCAVVQGASAGMQYQNAKAHAKANYARQKRQNDLARKNAIQRYSSAQLKKIVDCKLYDNIDNKTLFHIKSLFKSNLSNPRSWILKK